MKSYNVPKPDAATRERVLAQRNKQLRDDMLKSGERVSKTVELIKSAMDELRDTRGEHNCRAILRKAIAELTEWDHR